MKKGFTLVELLAVIVILGLLALIAVPTVTKTIKNYRQNLYDVQLSNIKDAAKTWASEDITRLPEDGSTKMVTLGTLKSDGLVDDDIKDPRTKEKLDDNSTYVLIKNISGRYKYTVVSNTVDSEFTMDSMCPGCVFTKYDISNSHYLDGKGSPNTLTDVTTTTDYTTLNSDYFLGHILENGVIKRSFVCGIEESGAFCLEGFLYEEKINSAKYKRNVDILKHFYPNCDANYDSSSALCDGKDILHAYSFSEGNVNIYKTNSIYCGVGYDGKSGCDY